MDFEKFFDGPQNKIARFFWIILMVIIFIAGMIFYTSALDLFGFLFGFVIVIFGPMWIIYYLGKWIVSFFRDRE